MSGPVKPLDPRLLEALRTERPAPRDVRARVRIRLESAIPGMRRGPAGGGDGGGANGAAGRGGGALGTYTVGVAAFLLGGASGAALFAALAAWPSPRVVYVDRSAPQMLAPATSAPLPTAAFGPILPSAPAPAGRSVLPSSASLPQIGSAHPAPAPHASRLTEERVLLDEARQALIQGEPERALDRLDLHRTRFPDGLLAEERDAMQVQALVHAERYDEARKRASHFRTRSPGSLFLPTVESAIASIP